MLNKILVFLGLAVFAILFFENLMFSSPILILWIRGKMSFLILVSTLVGFIIGYGLKGILNPKNDNNGELDF